MKFNVTVCGVSITTPSTTVVVVFFSTVTSNVPPSGKSIHFELSETLLILYVILLYSPVILLSNKEVFNGNVKLKVSVNLVSSSNICLNSSTSFNVDGSVPPLHPYSLILGIKKLPLNKLPFGLNAERFNKFGPTILPDVCIAPISFSPSSVLILNLYLPFVGIPTLGLLENINSPNSFVVT